MALAKLLQYCTDALPRKIGVRGLTPEHLKQPLYPVGLMQSVCDRSREQFGKKLGPRVEELKERFVHQMLQHVLPPDVCYECQLGPQRGNIGEVLFGTYAKIYPAGLDLFF